MKHAVLLGIPETKRAAYLNKAAKEENVPLSIVDWEGWQEHLPQGELFLKIDPPGWNTGILGELECLTGSYERELEALSCLKDRKVEYLNTPSVIAWLLHKRRCKERLEEAGLPVTEFLTDRTITREADSPGEVPQGDGRNIRIRNMEQLLEEMGRRRIRQVFIKPVCGSGAAGVSAFRLQPGTGRMMLYTCAADVPGLGLVNTKKLWVHDETEKIRHFLDRLLWMDCVVERWYAKAMYGSYSYDLRAVVQGGKLDQLLARLSRGPITNLQLNNHPLSADRMGFTLEQREMLEDLCRKAAACFPGLWSVGVDILLEKGSLNPRIIEMNAQGDLIYQDIYGENSIYRRQAERMKEWLSV